MNFSQARDLRFELLNAEIHDRQSFSSGVATVDNYLRNTARKQQNNKYTAVHIITDNGVTILGYVALNGHKVLYSDLPLALSKRKIPSHGEIPGAFLGMMGRDIKYAGQNIGGLLLVHALETCVKISKSVGCAYLMLDVLDCGDPSMKLKRHAFYKTYGFVPLPSQPDRLFLMLDTYLAA